MVGHDAPAPRPGSVRAVGPQRDSALAVLGALLDRSLIRIAEASADARSFDRETVRMTADVWDNNTFPLFSAATAGTRRARERRALAALEWMAGLGATRRTWMLEQASAAGHPLDALLSPAEPYLPGRDHLGHVMAPVTSLSARTAEGIAADYDLSSAVARHLRIEREGTALTGVLHLAVDRCYPLDADTAPETATLTVRLDDVTEVRFDSQDTRGILLRSQADGVSIGIGNHGALRAGAADFRPDDGTWHLSAAGRRADTTTPPRDERTVRAASPQEGRLGSNATAAAYVLHKAMLEIRSVRYAEHAPRIPVRGFQRIFSGAGTAILAAGGHRLPHRREAAFGRLVDTWVRRGGPAFADWFDTAIPKTVARPAVLTELRALRQAQAAAGAPKPQQPVPSLSALPNPLRTELRLASYTAAHTRYGSRQDASALLHLAVPPRLDAPDTSPWRLRAVPGTAPARFRLRTEAFHGAVDTRITVDATAAGDFDLRGEAFDITTEKS